MVRIVVCTNKEGKVTRIINGKELLHTEFRYWLESLRNLTAERCQQELEKRGWTLVEPDIHANEHEVTFERLCGDWAVPHTQLAPWRQKKTPKQPHK